MNATVPAPRLGFLGVGTLTTAIVRGLLSHGKRVTVELSPRSEAASRALASEFPAARRRATNADVVAASEIVCLAMRPPQLDAAIRGIAFGAGQVVVSFLAATPLEEVARAVAPAEACRIIPLPMIERATGPIVVFRAPPTVLDLFDGMGTVIEARDEAELAAYSAASAFMSSYFTLQGAMIDWVRRNGGSDEGAATYVRALLGGLGGTGLRAGRCSPGELVARHETMGGLNERVRATLGALGWFDAPGQAFDGLAHLRGSDLDARSAGAGTRTGDA